MEPFITYIMRINLWWVKFGQKFLWHCCQWD